eukprot:scaffold238398_cov19-Tisochrysis_lutea.AAC.1
MQLLGVCIMHGRGCLKREETKIRCSAKLATLCNQGSLRAKYRASAWHSMQPLAVVWCKLDVALTFWNENAYLLNMSKHCSSSHSLPAHAHTGATPPGYPSAPYGAPPAHGE